MGKCNDGPSDWWKHRKVSKDDQLCGNGPHLIGLARSFHKLCDDAPGSGPVTVFVETPTRYTRPAGETGINPHLPTIPKYPLQVRRTGSAQVHAGFGKPPAAG